MHGLPAVPTVRETVDGYPREVWCKAKGQDLMESYAISGMAHGTPLSVGPADDQCGAAGAFLLEVGISSSYRIAKFWGLAQVPRNAAAEDNKSVGNMPRPPSTIVIDERPLRPSFVDRRAAVFRRRHTRRHHPGPESRGADEDGLTGRLQKRSKLAVSNTNKPGYWLPSG